MGFFLRPVEEGVDPEFPRELGIPKTPGSTEVALREFHGDTR